MRVVATNVAARALVNFFFMGGSLDHENSTGSGGRGRGGGEISRPRRGCAALVVTILPTLTRLTYRPLSRPFVTFVEYDVLHFGGQRKIDCASD